MQTFLANKAAGFLESEFNIKASIGGVRISLPNKLNLTDVYVEDDHNDTLIYAQHLTVHYSGFNTKTNTLNSSRVALQNGRLYMRKYQQDSLFNFAYFLEKLASGESDTTQVSTPFRLKIASVDISDFRYIKHRLGCTDTCDNIFLTDANIQLDNFDLDGDYISANVLHMSYKDADRFDLIDFRAYAAYQSKYMSLRNWYFKTTGSEVNGDVVMSFDSGRDLNNFLELVTIKGSFKQSTFSSKEFIDWIPDFPQFDTFKITAEFEGTVNHFNVTDCVIDVGKNTRFFGNIHIDEPTETSLLNIEASVGEMHTTPADFRKYVGQFTGQMEWMEFLDQFKSFDFRGKYKGTINDFDVNGDFRFDENKLSIDAKMLNFDKPENAKYSGSFAAEKLNLKNLLAVEELGFVKFNVLVDGVGLTAASLNAKVKGAVDYFDLNGYRFHQLNVDGTVLDHLFDGEAVLKDPNLGLDFAGKIDFKTDTILADFRSTIKDANMFALGYSEAPISILNLIADIDFDIYKDSWWDGNIDVFDITYLGPERFYFFDTVQIVSTNSDKVHNDIVKSHLLEAEIYGEYNLPDVFNAFYAEYLDFNRLDFKKIDRPKVDFAYDVNLHNTELLTDIFLPELSIESGTHIKGQYQGERTNFTMNLESDLLRWKKMSFKQVQINASHQDSALSIQSKIGSFNISKQHVDSISLVSNLMNDSVWFETKGIFRDSIDSYFRLKGYALDVGTEDNEEYTIFLADGRFNVGNNYFDLLPENLIHITKGQIEFNNVGFYDQASSIIVQGFKSNDPNKVLRLVANNLDADLLNYLIRYKEAQFQGKMSGDVIVSYEDELPKFASSFRVDSLSINHDYLGDLNLESNWDIETNVVKIEADIKRKELSMFTADGNYYPDSAGVIDFNLHFNRFRLMWVNPFVEGILDQVRGVASGDVKITGTFKDIVTEGELTLNQVGIGVPYFATNYSLEGKPVITVSHNKFSLPLTIIRDTQESTSGTIVASMTHSNFTDWNMSLEVKTDNMLVLNTENTADAYFYGKGYAGGKFTINGPFEDLSIDVDITTNKGTDFKIPFSNPVSVGNQSFITYTGNSNGNFVVLDQDEIEERVLKPLGGLNISIKAKITPDAQVELVMDETVGDIIRGRGKGELRIDIPHDGDMQMFGSVEVVSGDYLFTMGNIINKKFVVLPGGNITWRGDPYEANVDMKAKYTTRTTLTGMVYNNYDGQRVQVDLIMALNGVVTNPNINFDVKLPNNANYQDELNNRLSDPDKLNMQAFSLLVINTFWTESLATESNLLGQSAGANTMQMATSQFSNWLGQGLGNFIDISVGYNTATNDQISDEIEVDISKRLFDDRVTVNSKIDVPVGTSTASTAQSFAGDIEIEYKITPDGRIRAKAFNRNNQDNPSLDQLSPYTQGIGISYQTSFNTFGDLIRKIFGIKPSEPEAVNN